MSERLASLQVRSVTLVAVVVVVVTRIESLSRLRVKRSLFKNQSLLPWLTPSLVRSRSAAAAAALYVTCTTICSLRFLSFFLSSVADMLVVPPFA